MTHSNVDNDNEGFAESWKNRNVKNAKMLPKTLIMSVLDSFITYYIFIIQPINDD